LNDFDSVQHKQLFDLCEQPDLADVLQSYDYICGLIFAVAAAPEIPMPDTWLIWVFRQRGQLSSPQQADHLTDVLMGLLQWQLRLMRDEQVALPKRCQLSEPAEQSMALSNYCNGLLAGHSQLEDVWRTSWQKMRLSSAEQLAHLQKDFRHCLGMFSTFADIPLAIEQAEHRGNDNFRNLLPKLYLSLPMALTKYVTLSGAMVDFLPDQFETFVQPTS
jgi:uncharacterized protein